MSRFALLLACLFPLAACTPPAVVFVPSKKPATELRAAQVRVVPGDPDSVMRDVVATLHDLGYRITKADPEAGTVSATRSTALRMAVVVRQGAGRTSVVRANASVVTQLVEAQVDSAEFYLADFFAPLQAGMRLSLTMAADDAQVPDAARPVAEINTARQREAAAATAAKAQAVPAPTKVSKP